MKSNRKFEKITYESIDKRVFFQIQRQKLPFLGNFEGYGPWCVRNSFGVVPAKAGIQPCRVSGVNTFQAAPQEESLDEMVVRGSAL